jgi:predicted lipid-binding transport protein (Tim44 family)
MLKLIIGFVIFAALAMFILTRSGGDVDLGGEKHSVEAPHGAASAAPAAPASAPAAAASAASAAPAASAASAGK